MKNTLLFATANANKVKEVKALLKDLPIDIVTMAEIGFTEEIPETGETLKENAILKAQYLFEKTGQNIIAEDTGLEVEALNGAPGVHTARYAGDAKNPSANMDLLLNNLKTKSNRSARFHTVMALILDGSLFTFDGFAYGEISSIRQGEEGFGYDPVFIPEGYDITFAEMTIEEKSQLSHRANALNQMLTFLTTLNQPK